MLKSSVVAVILLLVLVAPVHAKKDSGVDMGQYTCNDLLSEKVEHIGLVLMWVDGYLSSETGDLQMNQAWIEELAETIGEACQADRDRKLIDIVHEIAEAE